MFLIFPAEKKHPARRTKTTLPPGKKTSHAITRHTLHDTNMTSKFFTAANTFAPVNATNIQFLLAFSYKSEYRHAHTDTRKQTLYILMSMPAYLPPRNALLSRYTSKKLDGSEHLELLCEGKRSDYVQQQSVECHFAGSDSWVILSPIEQSIKRKIEAVGTPLKDWDINIYRGVLTGYNDAFIINTEKRDEILSNCQTEDERTRTAELIRPILRGRDIKRYGYNWANLWLINTHNGIRGKLERVHIEDYPAIKAHLDQYWDKISKRSDKGDTPYNLRNCAYLEDFFKPKVMWKIIGCNINFSFDEAKMICNNAVNIMVGKREQLVQFVGLMNSQLFDWYLKLTTEAEVQGGGIQLYVTTLEKTLVKLDFCNEFTSVIDERIRGIIDDDTLNSAVFDVYKLTETERKYISECKQVTRT